MTSMNKLGHACHVNTALLEGRLCDWSPPTLSLEGWVCDWSPLKWSFLSCWKPHWGGFTLSASGSFVSFTDLKFSVSGFPLVLPGTYSFLFMWSIPSCSPEPNTLFQVCHMSASWGFLHPSPSVFPRRVLSLMLKLSRAQLVAGQPLAFLSLPPQGWVPVVCQVSSFFSCLFYGFWESNSDLNCLQSKHSPQPPVM